MGILDSIRNALGRAEPAERNSPDERPATEPAAPAASAAARTYTVRSGDTLWKIAERVYGNGSQYMKIFEANRSILDQPEHIFPGQKLVIPEL